MLADWLRHERSVRDVLLAIPVTEDVGQSRLDRELIELLDELRVLLPGAEVIFAFLLILPFTERFGEVGELERLVYFGALLLNSAAIALLMAPTAYHRLRFREGDKEKMLRIGNRQAIAGSALLGLAMTAVVFLIADVLFGIPAAVVVAIANAAWFSWFWYGLPLRRKAETSS